MLKRRRRTTVSQRRISSVLVANLKHSIWHTWELHDQTSESDAFAVLQC